MGWMGWTDGMDGKDGIDGMGWDGWMDHGWTYVWVEVYTYIGMCM